MMFTIHFGGKPIIFGLTPSSKPQNQYTSKLPVVLLGMLRCSSKHHSLFFRSVTKKKHNLKINFPPIKSHL